MIKRVADALNRRYYTLKSGEYNNGVDIFQENWDNLIILDACRYDTFRRESSLPGTLKVKQSQGAATYEWLSANFTNRDLLDTVYISANLWYPKIQDDINSTVYKFIPVPKTGEDLDKVPPKLVTDAAKRASKEYPNKRLIIHYTQPHYPFIGDYGSRIFEGQEEASNIREAIKNTDNIDIETVEMAYRENLREALPYVYDLLENLQGRSVVTSDHGEMLGERANPIPTRLFGHIRGIYTEELITVPWLEHQNGPSRVIEAEDEAESVAIDEERINEQLQHLGYKV